MKRVGAGAGAGSLGLAGRVGHLHALDAQPSMLAALEESAAAGREGLFTPKGLPRGLRGARWAAGFLKRYRDETVFVSPPQFVQRTLIALLARDA